MGIKKDVKAKTKTIVIDTTTANQNNISSINTSENMQTVDLATYLKYVLTKGSREIEKIENKKIYDDTVVETLTDTDTTSTDVTELEDTLDKASTIDDDNSQSSEVTGKIVTDANGVIDTSKPVFKGTKYNVTEDDLVFLAYIGCREQGSPEGAKLEISQICNLFESSYNGGRYTDLKTFVQNCGWYGSLEKNSNYSNPGNAYVEVARSVVQEGNRYLTSNVVEHDCLSDIASISTGSNERANYIPGQTVCHNKYGANYVFVGFAPNGGDPYGYLV